MGENRFLELFERGRISDLRSLSRAWHDLVKRTHPDLTGTDESGQLFTQIHQEYHEAREFIRSLDKPSIDTPKPPELTRREFYTEFNDILRRGFPLDPSNTRLASTYFQSRTVLVAWFEKILGPDSFMAFENDLLDLKKNSTYFSDGPLMPVFYQICDFHQLGTSAPKRFVQSERPRMERLLKRRGKTALTSVLGWLIDDLKNGPALL